MRRIAFGWEAVVDTERLKSARQDALDFRRSFDSDGNPTVLDRVPAGVAGYLEALNLDVGPPLLLERLESETRRDT